MIEKLLFRETDDVTAVGDDDSHNIIVRGFVDTIKKDIYQNSGFIQKTCYLFGYHNLEEDALRYIMDCFFIKRVVGYKDDIRTNKGFTF